MLHPLKVLWNNYKYRFVPWISLNIVREEKKRLTKVENISYRLGKESFEKTETIQIDHAINDDVLISNSELRQKLVDFFEKLSYAKNPKYSTRDVYEKNSKIFFDHFGFLLGRRPSIVSPQAGQGIFVVEGTVKAGSLVALYPGTVYMPHEPLFFPSLGNTFIFRCSDNIHVDGNDRWISRSIFKSCAVRDQFGIDIACCDTTWLTEHPQNLLNIGQYVNNRSKTHMNNVVYQECKLFLTDVKHTRPHGVSEEECFPIKFARFIPNVWSNPENNSKFSLPIIPLVAVKDILSGDELLSSYFTVLHAPGS